ncbi:MAG: cytochrome B [Hyphomicrobium sp. 32-62-53]|nr:MAG: cytochrome B [Hyphomicrobium sp. 12-62-95]OYY01061.1 MAG: cytochrome B [Hyphomicrobium sp. 32-62-53]
MMRSLYDWMMRQAASDRAPTALFWVSFIESSVFPIPPDIMLIPMAIANRLKAWWYATVATVGSVLGGLLGYAIGYFLFDLVGQPILGFYGYGDKFQEFAGQYNEYGAWIVFMAGLTPFPFKVITIASGTTSMNIFVFILASIVGRASRFFAVAALLYFFGQPIREFIERYFGILTVLFFILLVGGFAAVKFLF